MTVGELPKSHRSMPCKCTSTNYFIQALSALLCVYIQCYHVVSFIQKALIKQGSFIRPHIASWGNGTSNFRYVHLLFVVSRVFNDTLSTALNGIRLNEKLVMMSATCLNLN